MDGSARSSLKSLSKPPPDVRIERSSSTYPEKKRYCGESSGARGLNTYTGKTVHSVWSKVMARPETLPSPGAGPSCLQTRLTRITVSQNNLLGESPPPSSSDIPAAFARCITEPNRDLGGSSGPFLFCYLCCFRDRITTSSWPA
jgi:hypothetical protein